MCGRTIVWGLTSDGPEQWGNGWFFDPEDGNTYNISAQIETNDRISARIYKGISLFGLYRDHDADRRAQPARLVRHRAFRRQSAFSRHCERSEAIPRG